MPCDVLLEYVPWNAESSDFGVLFEACVLCVVWCVDVWMCVCLCVCVLYDIISIYIYIHIYKKTVHGRMCLATCSSNMCPGMLNHPIQVGVLFEACVLCVCVCVCVSCAS